MCAYAVSVVFACVPLSLSGRRQYSHIVKRLERVLLTRFSILSVIWMAVVNVRACAVVTTAFLAV